MATETFLAVGAAGREGITIKREWKIFEKLKISHWKDWNYYYPLTMDFSGRFSESTTSNGPDNPRFVSATWEHVSTSASQRQRPETRCTGSFHQVQSVSCKINSVTVLCLALSLTVSEKPNRTLWIDKAYFLTKMEQRDNGSYFVWSTREKKLAIQYYVNYDGDTVR